MIKPLLNKVLIKIIKKDNTSKGGIILSEGTKEKITNSDGEEEEVVKKEFPAIGAKNTKSASIVWSR